MTLLLTPLHPDFAVRVSGVGPLRDMDRALFTRLRRALDEHGVLVFSGQPMSDEEQIEFSRWWGPLQTTKGVNPASGTPFARQSNLDLGTGDIIPPDDRRMDYQKGNYQWHADSTFKREPSLCSILSAREVPGAGGDTEFVSTRAAFEALPPELADSLADVIVEHDFSVSRGRVGFSFTPGEAALHPPAWHPLVQVNPVTGRRSLLIGAHASRLVDRPLEEGRALLEDLLERATSPGAIYAHRWSAGDLVIWDNRQVLHRATAYDSTHERRLMQRTTVGNPAILETDLYAAVRARQGAQP